VSDSLIQGDAKGSTVNTESKWRKRTGVILACGMLIGGLAVVAAPSAQAARACRSSADGASFNRRTIALPLKPDMVVDAELCLYNERGFYQAVVNLSWRSTTGGDGIGTKFNNFVVVGAVQKNNRNKCRVTTTPSVNSNATGSNTSSCRWRAANTRGVTTDAKIVYDVADDGKPAHTWNMTGTHDV
jgi:hypothetical protein